MRRPDIDAAVRPLTRGMILPEAIRMMRGVYAAGGSQCRPSSYTATATTPGPSRSSDVSAAIRSVTPNVEFSYVDDAAHFIADDAPAAVADFAIDWFERAA